MDPHTSPSPGSAAGGEGPTTPASPDAQREADELRSRLVAREARLAEVEAELAAVRRVREAEVRHLDTRIADLEKLYLQLLERDERIADLEAQLQRAGADPGTVTLPEEGAAGPGPASMVPDSFITWEAWFRSRLRDREGDETTRLREAVAHQRGVLDEKEALIRRLLDRLGVAPEALSGPDDLKLISGVGPALERLLHKLGITTYEQIATFDDAEIDRVAGALGAFDYRIRSDHWVEQAAELARKKVAGGLLLPSTEPL